MSDTTPPAAPAVPDPACTPQSAHLSSTLASPSVDSNTHLSPDASVYQSPIRHHRRTPSQHREVKETLNAVSLFADEEDGQPSHKVNQYTIKSMIGRGSYGAVHAATNQYGQEFAIKEVSKARLRKRARTNILRQGPGARRHGIPLPPAARFEDETRAEAKDALYLIREEVAIMKKLNHPNLVQLIEVLDDPDEDSLYMVLEMCRKGVIMDVGLNKSAKPYDEKNCRYWFRDLILGIEYLHAQNVVHRDIKPDNLLLTDDDVLKIGDFGVSELFEKSDEMLTTKTAGSPAFLPPELCVARPGEVSGPACDIWSMGVTLYCLRYGRIPFEHNSLVEILNAINTDEAQLAPDESPDFVDLMQRILEKDPARRITMPELRDHPWVTMGGSDPLLSAEENCADLIEPPNELEVNHAFTRNMGHLFCVIKAIRIFKGLLRSRENALHITGIVPPADDKTASPADTSADDEVERLVLEIRENKRKASLHVDKLRVLTANNTQDGDGPASDVLAGVGDTDSNRSLAESRPPVLLGIGTGGINDFGGGQQGVGNFVSESPTAADFDVSSKAFDAEASRLRTQRSRPSMYPVDEPAQDLSGPVRTLSLADVVTRAMEESRP